MFQVQLHDSSHHYYSYNLHHHSENHLHHHHLLDGQIDPLGHLDGLWIHNTLADIDLCCILDDWIQDKGSLILSWGLQGRAQGSLVVRC
jgi:hypothetical protein